MADAYVYNSGGGTISVVNVSTNAVTATVTVGTGPHGIAISAGGAPSNTSGLLSILFV